MKILPATKLLVALAFMASCSLSFAKEDKTKGADLKFVSSVTAVQPGVPFTIALHIHHHPGFHTYWKNPGIVGIATSIDWSLPQGFQASPILWPAPEVVDMATHPAHGYHRDVLLLTEITPPKDLATDSLTFTGKLAWMACEKECHPGFGQRTITLPVSRKAVPEPHPEWASAIAAERQNLPAPTDLWTVAVESKAGASPIVIRVRPSPNASPDPGEIYFFSEDGQISSEPPQSVERQEDGSYLIVAERSEWGPKNQATLPGTLVGSGSWSTSKQLRAFSASPRYQE